jgi:hypothetical protein
MGLSIKNKETYRLVEELAELTGEAPPSLDTPRPRLRRSLSAATRADFAPPSLTLGEP